VRYALKNFNHAPSEAVKNRNRAAKTKANGKRAKPHGSNERLKNNLNHL
jgi:hypothetical protein